MSKKTSEQSPLLDSATEILEMTPKTLDILIREGVVVLTSRSEKSSNPEISIEQTVLYDREIDGPFSSMKLDAVKPRVQHHVFSIRLIDTKPCGVAS